MAEYVFEIQVEGFEEAIREDTDAFGELASKLHEIGPGDLGLSLQGGAVIVDVWRDDCASPKDALLKSIEELRSLGLRAVRIGPDDFVTAAELAERLHRTPASIAQLIKGDRGRGSFPPPVVMHARKSRVYSYVKVLQWTLETSTDLIEHAAAELRKAKAIKTANDALGLIQECVVAEDKLPELIRE